MHRLILSGAAALLLSGCSAQLGTVFTPPTEASYSPAATDLARQARTRNFQVVDSEPPARARLWTVRAGETFKQVMQRFADEEGYQLRWKALDDCRIEADAAVVETFARAVELVNAGLSSACPAYLPQFVHGNAQLQIFQDGSF